MSTETRDHSLDLTERLRNREEAAFADLYDAYSDMLFGIILRIVQEQEDAENLLQDCFIKVWHHIEQFDAGKGRLATWLINIARNAAIDFTRSKYYSQRSKIQELEKIVGFSYHQPNEETLGLRQLLDQLNPLYRQVLEWMYFEGYTQQEIADTFGIPLGTVKSRTRLGLKELRSYFCES